MRGFMNTIIVTKETFSEELKDILVKNGCQPIQSIRSIGMVESKLSGKKNIVIYEWQGEVQEELANLKEFMKEANQDRIKVLLFLDQGIKDAIATISKYDNIKFIFKPVTKERLHIGLRMLLFERKQPPKLSIEYINPFIESIIMVLKQMASTELEKKEVRAENGLRMHGDISGVMALSGKASGFVVVSMGAETAFNLVRSMTNGDLKEDEERIVESGIMELINIISGQAQALFNQNQLHFDFTTPTMIRGKDHQIYHGQMASTIVVRFETPEKRDIFLQVCLKHT